MHEVALCESILKVIEEQSAGQGVRRVRRVRLEVGELAGVELAALRFGFAVVTRGSMAAGAELVILNVPGSAWCLTCSKRVPLARRYDACPDCGGYQLQVTSGEELRIKDMEVE